MTLIDFSAGFRECFGLGFFTGSIFVLVLDVILDMIKISKLEGENN